MMRCSCMVTPESRMPCGVYVKGKREMLGFRI